MNEKEMRNASGCYDSTCYIACEHIEKESKQAEFKRKRELVKQILDLCTEAGFHMENRIVLKGIKSGYIWK